MLAKTNLHLKCIGRHDVDTFTTFSLLCPILKQLSHFNITAPFWHKTLPCFEINVLDLLWNNVCPTLKQKVFLAPNFLVDWSSNWWWCHSHVILKNIKCNNFWKCWGHKTWPAGIAGKYEISGPFDNDGVPTFLKSKRDMLYTNLICRCISSTN